MDDGRIVELYWARSEKALTETQIKYSSPAAFTWQPDFFVLFCNCNKLWSWRMGYDKTTFNTW